MPCMCRPQPCRAPCRALPDSVPNLNAGRQREACQACDAEPPSCGGADLLGLHRQAGGACTCSALRSAHAVHAHCSPTLRMSPMVATTPTQFSARITSLRSPVPDLTASRSPLRPASALTTASAPITAAVCLRLHPCALYAASLHASACALHPCCLCLAPCLRPAPQPPPMLPPITAATSAPYALHTTSTKKTVTSLGRSR